MKSGEAEAYITSKPGADLFAKDDCVFHIGILPLMKFFFDNFINYKASNTFGQFNYGIFFNQKFDLETREKIEKAVRVTKANATINSYLRHKYFNKIESCDENFLRKFSITFYLRGFEKIHFY